MRAEREAARPKGSPRAREERTQVDVEAYMAERIPQVDAAIESCLARIGAEAGDVPVLPARLSGAMRHLLFPGGKRLRPVFCLAAAEAMGAGTAVALPLGVAVELVHTYSLMHDDLPCMDDDDFRRGRPTVHKAYDEATAVLAGDALLTEAFGLLASGELAGAAPAVGLSAPPDAAARLFAIGRLSRAAGAAGLVGGQVDDLAFETGTNGQGNSAAGEADAGTRHAWLASIHARKTAALFQAAIVGGAALAGATRDRLEVLEAFARDVGIGFQIADDVLDADSNESASILRLDGIDGVDDARLSAEELLERALGRIEGWGEAAEPLRALSRFAVRRTV